MIMLNHIFVKLKSQTSHNEIGDVRVSDHCMSPHSYFHAGISSLLKVSKGLKLDFVYLYAITSAKIAVLTWSKFDTPLKVRIVKKN